MNYRWTYSSYFWILSGKRTHFWYAVVADCYLEEYDAHPPAVHFDIKFLNGKSHLPADESGLPTIFSLVLLATAAFGLFTINLLTSQYKQLGQVCFSPFYNPAPSHLLMCF
jgi:hypothetical protein